MSSRSSLLNWQKWLVLYLGTVVLGSIVFFGGGFFPQNWFAGWVWWQRLALILVASPLVLVAWMLFESLLVAVLHGVVYAFKLHPLPALVTFAVVVAFVYSVVGPLLG